MRCLVTGGAGFIGSNLVDALVERGDEVTVVDDLSTGRRENLEAACDRGVELIEADVTDAEAMAAVCSGCAPETVFHLAAQIDVRRSVVDPAADAAINVGGTITMLRAALAGGVRRFVNASTGGAIYGETDHIPTAESHQPAPEAPYGQSKLAAEGYCELFRRLHGFSTVSLRYGNVFGPRQDPLGEAGVLAIFCGKLLAEEQATVFGDGLQTRDYVYVGDVVDANLAAAAADAGGAFNIGRGVETTVLDIVEALRELGDRSFQPIHADERAGEVRRSALDPSRAREQLGWSAVVDVREGLSRTMAHLERTTSSEA